MNSYGNHGANPSRKATIQVYHDTLSAKIGLSLVVQKMNTISKTTIFNVVVGSQAEATPSDALFL